MEVVRKELLAQPLSVGSSAGTELSSSHVTQDACSVQSARHLMFRTSEVEGPELLLLCLLVGELAFDLDSGLYYTVATLPPDQSCLYLATPLPIALGCPSIPPSASANQVHQVHATCALLCSERLRCYLSHSRHIRAQSQSTLVDAAYRCPQRRKAARPQSRAFIQYSHSPCSATAFQGSTRSGHGR